MKSNSLTGACLCGAVSFEVSGTLPHLYQCHCSLCRKLSGSASDTATFLDKDQFRWLAGEENISSYKTDTGYRSDFCKTCGSTVPHLMSNGNQVWVPAGLLNGEYDSKVVAHLFVGSKAHWDKIGDDGTQHDSMPDMTELNGLLQGT